MNAKDLFAGLLLACTYALLFGLALAYELEAVCGTDTECGCTDDCLEPMIQDEAQTTMSQGRN